MTFIRFENYIYNKDDIVGVEYECGIAKVPGFKGDLNKVYITCAKGNHFFVKEYEYNSCENALKAFARLEKSLCIY